MTASPRAPRRSTGRRRDRWTDAGLLALLPLAAALCMAVVVLVA